MYLILIKCVVNYLSLIDYYLYVGFEERKYLCNCKDIKELNMWDLIFWFRNSLLI